mmetsp:Transcript_48698/g.140033  ORF Transcript_48698/g.140033 Transcript_48698/m.140033 type:complete len:274 (-) Transcript_48698:1264-2085(-)
MCLPTPPFAFTCPTQDSINCTFCFLSDPTVIMIMLRSEGCRCDNIFETTCPHEFSARLPKSSPSVRHTSHREGQLAVVNSCKDLATASKKQVPPMVSGRNCSMRLSRSLPALPAICVGGTTTSTLLPKPTTATESTLRTWFFKMLRTHAEQVAKRDSDVPVSRESIEQLLSRQKTTMRSPGPLRNEAPPSPPPGLAATRLARSAGPRSVACVGTLLGLKSGSWAKASSSSRMLSHRMRWQTSTIRSRHSASSRSSARELKIASQSSFIRKPTL